MLSTNINKFIPTVEMTNYGFQGLYETVKIHKYLQKPTFIFT